MTSRVVIIGAGLGGLSAACHLTGADVDVTVIERAHSPGGLAARIEQAGFRFDVGPTVLTMPDLVERCFAAAGVTMSEELTLRPLDPMYRAVFADGSELRVRPGREVMAAEIRQLSGPADAAAFHRFADWLTALYRCEMPNFIERDVDSLIDLVRPLRPLLRLLRLGGFGRLDAVVRRAFSDERLRRVFSFQTLYAGLAPHRALALFAVITYMDTINGVVAADGGVHELPAALARAAGRAGVRLRYGEAVTRIETAHDRGGPVRAVHLAGGERIPCDVVVANGDLAATFHSLLPVRPPRPVRRAAYSPSAVVWHVGVRGELPVGVGHHNVHFGRAWRGSFDALLRDGRRMPDPSRLISIPTVTAPDLAPAGAHVLYVLEPVPNLDAPIDWATERSRVRDDLAAFLVDAGYPGDLETELLVDPVDWRAQGLTRGTPFSIDHRFLQSGPFRPDNHDRRVPGLYFTGADTRPGVGVPMVLISGELTARRIREEVLR